MRSVLAVLAGIVVLTLTSFAIEWASNYLLMALFPAAFPSEAALIASLPVKLFMAFYTSACIVAGAYVTARIARKNEIVHTVALGVIQVAFTVAAMNEFGDHAPLWFWVLGMALTVPAAWLGGWLRVRQRSSIPAAPEGAVA